MGVTPLASGTFSPEDRAELESIELIIEDCAARLLDRTTAIQRADISGSLIDQAMRLHTMLRWPGTYNGNHRFPSLADRVAS